MQGTSAATDEQHDWVTQICGIDTRSAVVEADRSVAPGTSQEADRSSPPPLGDDPEPPVVPATTQVADQSVAPPVTDDASQPADPGILVGAMASGLPNGPDPCGSILEQIVDLLNEVAQRINDAVNDPHNLYRDYRSKPHPEYGSWDGHRDRFYYDRDRLRHKIAEWEADDRCKGRRLSSQEQEDLDEAYEYREKDFPEKPADSMRQETTPDPAPQPSGVSWKQVAEALAVLGLSVALVATVVACLADPEPATKLGLAGLSAAEIEELLVLLGLAAKTAS